MKETAIVEDITMPKIKQGNTLRNELKATPPASTTEDTYHDSAQKDCSAGVVVASLNKTFTPNICQSQICTPTQSRNWMVTCVLPLFRFLSNIGGQMGTCHRGSSCIETGSVMGKLTMQSNTGSRPSENASTMRHQGQGLGHTEAGPQEIATSS